MSGDVCRDPLFFWVGTHFGFRDLRIKKGVYVKRLRPLEAVGSQQLEKGGR